MSGHWLGLRGFPGAPVELNQFPRPALVRTFMTSENLQTHERGYLVPNAVAEGSEFFIFASSWRGRFFKPRPISSSSRAGTIVGFLNSTKTFHDFFAIFTTPAIAPITTFLVEYGHLLIGVSLLTGLMVRVSAAFGVLLMITYWFAHMDWPFIENTNNFIIDYHMVYAGVLVTLIVTRAGHVFRPRCLGGESQLREATSRAQAIGRLKSGGSTDTKGTAQAGLFVSLSAIGRGGWCTECRF